MSCYPSTENSARSTRKSGPAVVSPSLVVSYGIGIDSIAMIILLRDLGISPDQNLFANTGGEKPSTSARLAQTEVPSYLSSHFIKQADDPPAGPMAKIVEPS